MSTRITLDQSDIAHWPYMLYFNGRTFCLTPAPGSKSWELLEYDEGPHIPVLLRFSSRKNHERMVGESIAHVLALIKVKP